MDVHLLTHDPLEGWGTQLPTLADGPQLGLVFGQADLLDDAGPLDTLAAAYPEMVLAGCASPVDEADAGDLVATVVSFQSSRVLARSSRITRPSDSPSVGTTLGRCLNGPSPAAVLVFGDGRGVDGDALLVSLSSTLPAGTVVAGGLMESDTRSWTIVDGRPTEGHVTALGLYGVDVDLGGDTRQSTRHGSVPASAPHMAMAAGAPLPVMSTAADGVAASGAALVGLIPTPLLDEHGGRTSSAVISESGRPALVGG